MSEPQKKDESIGALWVKEGPRGNYMSGEIEIDGKKHSIVCFTNDHKKEAKHPDWRILFRKPVSRDEAQAQAEATRPTYPEEEINPEDIPF